MEVTFYRADPAGNITLLVTSEVAPESRAEAAKKLLALPGLGAEQVGFLVPPRSAQADGRLEMMGGEFCGNALRSAGFLLARRQGITDQKVMTLECSGAEGLLQVGAAVGKQEATAQMPLPRGEGTAELMGKTVTYVVFPGITHAIVDEEKPDRAWAETAVRELAEKLSAPAAGIMFLHHEGADFWLEPVVYVAGTDTVYFESSCASGSAAALVYLSDGSADGIHSYTLRQPGGTIKTSMVSLDGEMMILTVGGPVTLGPEQTLDL